MILLEYIGRTGENVKQILYFSTKNEIKNFLHIFPSVESVIKAVLVTSIINTRCKTTIYIIYLSVLGRIYGQVVNKE